MMMDGCCSAAKPCLHQRFSPETVCAVCEEAAKDPVVKRDQLWVDRHWLGVARAVAKASKDPSTKVGAIIIRPDGTDASTGFNGFPRSIRDTRRRLHDRQTKYSLVLHAEENAILKARENLAGCTLYVTPLFSCKNCALRIIQAGIVRVVSPPPDQARWQSSYDEAMELYREAGVEYAFIEGENEE